MALPTIPELNATDALTVRRLILRLQSFPQEALVFDARLVPVEHVRYAAGHVVVESAGH